MDVLSRGRLMLGLTLVVAACGSGGASHGTEPARSSSPIAAVSTTTTAPASTISPLTGVPGDAATITRPALVVKIDNVAQAHPQSGINQADIVYEELVENSSTRLMAMFQSTDAGPIGPVRSARPTDLLLFTPLNRPLFAWSGANAWVRDMVEGSNIVDVGNTPAVDQYFRDGDREAPHNLFIQGYAPMLSAHQNDAGAPPALLSYRAPGAPLGAGARAITGVHIEWGKFGGNAPVDYVWDAAIGGWRRSQAGAPHVDTAGVQVAPPNVIVQFADYEINGGIPDGQLLGQGVAWVLTAGNLIEGTWVKSSPEAPTQYFDATGAPIALTPGRTWISLPPPGNATVID